MLFFSEYYNAPNLKTLSNNNKQNSILSPKPTNYKLQKIWTYKKLLHQRPYLCKVRWKKQLIILYY